MSRQCQQIGVDIEQTMQHGQEFERNFGKKMCRLAMFVSLAQFISIEMKKILKEYAKGIIPRACAKIRRLFGRSPAIQTVADGAGTGSTTTPSMVQRECKAKLMAIYMDIKMNEIYFEKIFDFMYLAKDLMIKTRADVDDPRHIQSARVIRKLT
ncbi:hypothetical protein niasHT_031970 [Heterodera trifolii]|uniref:Uncharacterized protein n=1 Tax=Heterodera trifolii TaxID=157864 RepID=A0ABD2I2I4_9BILA